jgi:hypothetical protein
MLFYAQYFSIVIVLISVVLVEKEPKCVQILQETSREMVSQSNYILYLNNYDFMLFR